MPTVINAFNLYTVIELGRDGQSPKVHKNMRFNYSTVDDVQQAFWFWTDGAYPNVRIDWANDFDKGCINPGWFYPST
jgi:hypothetical protein